MSKVGGHLKEKGKRRGSKMRRSENWPVTRSGKENRKRPIPQAVLFIRELLMGTWSAWTVTS